MNSLPVISQRVELAKLCSSRDWSKAIRVLDSLLASSSSIQDMCNRAFCYSQLDLHKHVIKDCDRALQLDPTILQAYILKGHALSSLGRKNEALIAWEVGYEKAQCQSADLKQLLELEDLLKSARKKEIKMPEDPAPQLRDSAIPLVDNGKSAVGNVIGSLDNLSSLNYLNNNVTDEYITCSFSGSKLETQNNKSALSSSLDKMGVQNGIHCEIEQNGLGSNGRPCLSELQIDRFNDDCSLSSEFENSSECHTRSLLSTESDVVGDIGNFENSHERWNGSNMNNGYKSRQSVRSNKITEVGQLSSLEPDSVSPSDKCITFNASQTSNASGSDDYFRNRRFSSTKSAKVNSISVDFRLSRGIAQVNEGKYDAAISIFNQILKDDSSYAEALIGRGTAYAFQRELEAAISDFSSAIGFNPSACEAWKRRGQARAALGDFVEAIHDLTKAMEFEANSADILHERGIVNFKSKEFRAAIDDLSTCVKLDKDFKSAYTYMGLAFFFAGEYAKAEESHLKAISLDTNYLEAWIHLIQFYIDLANSAKAFDCIEEAIKIDSRSPKLYYLRGMLLHGLGKHRKAVKDLSESLTLEKSNIDCLYLRASCYHAIGEYTEAVKDYDATLDLELDSIEKFSLQCLAFYQKEIALYTAAKASSEFLWFELDRDIDPLFKEYWCSKKHPKDVCEKVYRQPPLRESLKGDKLRRKEKSFAKRKSTLVAAADLIGRNIQYHCPGFLHNKRQHRMAGLAAIEIAQKVSKAWRSLNFKWKQSTKNSGKSSNRQRRRTYLPIQNRGGGGCSTSTASDMSPSSSLDEDKSSMRPSLSWHDVYSLAVKWRQISEPCEPVVWISKLSDKFNTEFSATTFLGQAKSLFCDSYIERTLTVAKTFLHDKMSVRNKADEILTIPSQKLQRIANAKTASDLHEEIGEDFSIATWCDSTVYDGKRLEGSIIFFAKTGESGYDFGVKTPCTSSKFNDFDEEMTAAWENICVEYYGETYGSLNLDALQNVVGSILRMTYYWYNCKPLSKDSASVGLIVLLGLLLAANLEFNGEIPKNVQPDWEAILNSHPNFFIDSIKTWMNPFLKPSTSWRDIPDVPSTLSTIRSIIDALSFKDE